MRFKSSKSKLLKKRHLLVIVLVLMIFFSVQGFLFVEHNLDPTLREIAQTYVKQVAMLAINDAISKKINEQMGELDQMVIVERNAHNEIELISFDHAQQARIMALVMERTYMTLLELSKEPVPLPLGQALNSNILAHLGPNVPITLVPIGAAKADINYVIEDAGINVVTIVAYLTIEADVRIVIPFASDEAVVQTSIPISHVTINGKVPDFYFKSDGGHQLPLPNISLPESGAGGSLGIGGLSGG